MRGADKREVKEKTKRLSKKLLCAPGCCSLLGLIFDSIQQLSSTRKDSKITKGFVKKNTVHGCHCFLLVSHVDVRGAEPSMEQGGERVCPYNASAFDSYILAFVYCRITRMASKSASL